MSRPGRPGRFRELLAKRLGWTFADNDARQLEDLLRDRAAQHGMHVEDYLTRLDARPWEAEVTELVERLSITETYFFRHGEQFAALREDALPERIAARSAQRTLRMLSVACSSGEEAYSLAIAARQARPDPDWLISVTGVDANPQVLRKAEKAWYSTWSLRETPDTVRRRWFRQADSGYWVVDEIRRLVRFQRTNVAAPDDDLWRPEQYDVVFCRNLLMYLTPDVVSALVERMTRALVPGGFLFLGHTDSLGSNPAGLELRHSHHSFYYRRHGGPTPLQRIAPAPAASSPPVPSYAVRPEPVVPEDVYPRALDLLRQERFTDALELLTASGPGPLEPRDRLLHGVLLAHTGRLDEAVALARKLSDDNGLNPDAHQLLGLCLEDGSAVAEAIGQYRLAAYLDPGFALPRMRLGQLARRQGDDRTAAGELERALDLLAQEDDRRITLFGGGFGRIALTVLCRSELDACAVRP
ncbi:protein-glutamate O-methyltransferase [Paractinoplanes abujensis]|uniref:Chemotaxis protein methyltransferase CheR n=1 Tax=Paractinoplanes abujensis TaxID=882441 RepID=A0A7W7G1H6_9ACTN|nr:protein-glutamate O-methyltransferase CheR [Actinoplanes abujensis]MBB4690626.1 chemotaxis protein methyltransferase CheR [Actinoplanes abujensis]GID17960.1 protein-glutamate O-methyltransferase [Actinoplanes abujensis]